MRLFATLFQALLNQFRKIAIAKMAAGYTRYGLLLSGSLWLVLSCVSVFLWSLEWTHIVILHLFQQVKADKALGNALSSKF